MPLGDFAGFDERLAGEEKDSSPASARSPINEKSVPPIAVAEAVGIDLAWVRQTKRRELDDLFARCLSGALPRDRALKAWEPDTIDERHLQVIMLRASGMQQGAIAKLTGFTEPWVSIILNHPDAQYVLTRMVSYASDSVIDMQARIQAVAPEALDVVVETMRTSTDVKLRTATAFELLSMAGYGRKEQKKVEVEHSFPAKAVDDLTSAIREAQEIPSNPGSYVVVSTPSRSGDLGSVSPVQPAAASGLSGVGPPPVSGLQGEEEAAA